MADAANRSRLANMVVLLFRIDGSAAGLRTARVDTPMTVLQLVFMAHDSSVRSRVFKVECRHNPVRQQYAPAHWFGVEGPSTTARTPTQHNPTTATLSPERRKRCGDHSQAVYVPVEDDASVCWSQAASPVRDSFPSALISPSVCSKCIAPGHGGSPNLLVPDSEVHD